MYTSYPAVLHLWQKQMPYLQQQPIAHLQKGKQEHLLDLIKTKICTQQRHAHDILLVAHAMHIIHGMGCSQQSHLNLSGHHGVFGHITSGHLYCEAIQKYKLCTFRPDVRFYSADRGTQL